MNKQNPSAVFPTVVPEITSAINQHTVFCEPFLDGFQEDSKNTEYMTTDLVSFNPSFWMTSSICFAVIGELGYFSNAWKEIING